LLLWEELRDSPRLEFRIDSVSNDGNSMVVQYEGGPALLELVGAYRDLRKELRKYLRSLPSYYEGTDYRKLLQGALVVVRADPSGVGHTYEVGVPENTLAYERTEAMPLDDMEMQWSK